MSLIYVESEERSVSAASISSGKLGTIMNVAILLTTLNPPIIKVLSSPSHSGAPEINDPSATPIAPKPIRILEGTFSKHGTMKRKRM